MLESKNQNFNHLKIHSQYSICEGAVKIDELKDPKSCLQELIQKKYKSLPRYSSKENTTSSYKSRFEATCYVDEAKLTTNGTAKTRKGAELEAAAVMLKLMEENES